MRKSNLNGLISYLLCDRGQRSAEVPSQQVPEAAAAQESRARGQTRLPAAALILVLIHHVNWKDRKSHD